MAASRIAGAAHSAVPGAALSSGTTANKARPQTSAWRGRNLLEGDVMVLVDRRVLLEFHARGGTVGTVVRAAAFLAGEPAAGDDRDRGMNAAQLEQLPVRVRRRFERNPAQPLARLGQFLARSNDAAAFPRDLA